jgi:hypothetical protein
VPQIDGLWTIGNVNSNKGEAAWRFIVRQSGAEVTAAILRVDGDTGALAGTFQRNGKFIVSHFSGARPLVLELTPQKDGTLEIVRNRRKDDRHQDTEAKLKGCRADRPVAPSGEESDEPFKFAFPDINGKIVSSTDSVSAEGRDRRDRRQRVARIATMRRRSSGALHEDRAGDSRSSSCRLKKRRRRRRALPACWRSTSATA